MFDFDTLRPGILVEPEGLIARRKDLRRAAFTTAVGSLPRKPALMLAPETSVAAAARRLADSGTGAALVICSGTVLGLLGEPEVVACVASGADLGHTSVWQAMSPEPPFCLDTDCIASALRVMKTHNARQLPILRADGPPVGLLDGATIGRWFSDQLTALILD
jgi:predicted transcriptional regulator